MYKKLTITLAMIATLLLASNVKAMPLIGDIAPSFKADTTGGKIDFPADYKGKWVVLFSHPADFTPVCTTEFMAFQKLEPNFNSLNTKLIGLSESNTKQHREWIESIKGINYNSCADTQITFPIIDDENGNIAKKYGMLQNDTHNTKTVRSVFIIDPESKIRAIIYYPQSTGRYMPEIQRLVIALQTSDAFGVSTPADWMPGDDVIVPTNKIPEGNPAELLEEMGITEHSPYLYTQKLDINSIKEKLIK